MTCGLTVRYTHRWEPPGWQAVTRMASGDFSDPRYLIGARELAERRTAVTLMDLRPAEDFAVGHIEGSGHLDIYGVVGSAEMASELQGRLYRIGVNAHAWGEVHHGLASAAILSDRAVAAFDAGRFRETILFLDQLAQLRTERADLMVLRGYAYKGLNRNADARRIFEALAATGQRDAVRALGDMRDQGTRPH